MPLAASTIWRPTPLPAPVPHTTPTAPRVVECQGKRTYPTLRAAKRAAHATNSYPGDGGGRLEAYRCSWCGDHHIGHKPAALTVLSRRIGELRRRGGDFE